MLHVHVGSYHSWLLLAAGWLGPPPAAGCGRSGGATMLWVALVALTLAGNQSVPCVFNRPFLGWTGASSSCRPGAQVACQTSSDCASLPGACCPHYGPGVGTCAGLSCLRSDDNSSSAFCGVNVTSPGGHGPGGASTPAGVCFTNTSYPICGFCNAGGCTAGSASCVSKTTCEDPSPAMSLTCYPKGHSAPHPE